MSKDSESQFEIYPDPEAMRYHVFNLPIDEKLPKNKRPKASYAGYYNSDIPEHLENQISDTLFRLVPSYEASNTLTMIFISDVLDYKMQEDGAGEQRWLPTTYPFQHTFVLNAGHLQDFFTKWFEYVNSQHEEARLLTYENMDISGSKLFFDGIISIEDDNLKQSPDILGQDGKQVQSWRNENFEQVPGSDQYIAKSYVNERYLITNPDTQIVESVAEWIQKSKDPKNVGQKHSLNLHQPNSIYGTKLLMGPNAIEKTVKVTAQISNQRGDTQLITVLVGRS